MIAKRLFLVLAAGALLLLQFADCMSAVTPDQQSMQCCGSMHCTPANHKHDCCKTMVSAHAPNMLPAARVSLNAPAVVNIQHLATLETARPPTVRPVTVEAQQHSPPELYTLHASLLI
jgi:hypothetical protein